MPTITRFEDLEIWKLAEAQEKAIFQLTLDGLFSKDFGLRDQIRRSSSSVMDNAAEGFERGGRLEFRNFLSYSKGSNGEVRSQIYTANNRGYLTPEIFEQRILKNEEISIKINKMMEYLTKTDRKGTKYQ
jgi:four helix bundle protein